ncbi:MAG: hypothetical protein OCC49_08265 [Fibrobacterales bacterium]
MPEWSENAQEDSSKEMSDDSVSASLPCHKKDWSPVIDIEEEPEWEIKIDIED